MIRNTLATAALIAMSIGTIHAEKTRPLELKWSELAPMIQRHSVELTLTGGARVTGDVATIREEAMVLDVKKTSDARAYPKGNASIARDSIQLVKLTRSAGWGKRLGVGLGLLSGIVVGGLVASKAQSSEESAAAVIFVVAGAMSVGGYLLGRRADQRVTTIRVVP